MPSCPGNLLFDLALLIAPFLNLTQLIRLNATLGKARKLIGITEVTLAEIACQSMIAGYAEHGANSGNTILKLSNDDVDQEATLWPVLHSIENILLEPRAPLSFNSKSITSKNVTLTNIMNISIGQSGLPTNRLESHMIKVAKLSRELLRKRSTTSNVSHQIGNAILKLDLDATHDEKESEELKTFLLGILHAFKVFRANRHANIGFVRQDDLPTGFSTEILAHSLLATFSLRNPQIKLEIEFSDELIVDFVTLDFPNNNKRFFVGFDFSMSTVYVLKSIYDASSVIIDKPKLMGRRGVKAIPVSNRNVSEVASEISTYILNLL